MGLIKSGMSYILNFIGSLDTVGNGMKTLWAIGLSLLVVIEGERIDPWVAEHFPDYSHMQPTGAIMIGSPSVFTRERLINSRLRKRDWLEEQLKYTLHEDSTEASRGNFNFTHAITDIRKSVSADISAGEEEKPDEQALNNQSQNRRSTTSLKKPQKPNGSAEDNSQLSSKIPTEFQFSMLQSYREKVDHEWLKTQLDDRHDIAGNTIAQLSFDVSLFVPPNSTDGTDDKIAWIRMSAGQEKDKLKDRIPVLLEEWEQYLQKTIDNAVINREALFLANTGRSHVFNKAIALSFESLSQDPLIRQFFNTNPLIISAAGADQNGLQEKTAIKKIKDSIPYSSNKSQLENQPLASVLATRKKLQNFYTEYRKHIDISIQYSVARKRFDALKTFCKPYSLPASKENQGSTFEDLCKEINIYQPEKNGKNSYELFPYKWDLTDYRSKYADIDKNAELLINSLCRSQGTRPSDSRTNGSQAPRSQGSLCEELSAQNFSSKLFPIIKLLEFRSLLLNSGYAYSDERHNDFYFPRLAANDNPPPLVTQPNDTVLSSLAINGLSTFIKNQCADRDADRSSDSATFNGRLKKIFCIPSIHNEKKKYLALLSAAITLNDLKQKELDKVFNINLDQCFDDECSVKISQFTKIRKLDVEKCTTDLLKLNTEIYAYDVRGETSKANKVNRQVSNILKLSALSTKTLANSDAMLEIMNEVDKKDWQLNQEVIGYAISPQDKTPSLMDEIAFPKSCEKLGMSKRNVEGAHGNDAPTHFGWLIRPIGQQIGGIVKYPVNTLLSVPSWFQTLKLRVNSCWIRARDIGKTYDYASYAGQETPEFCIPESGEKTKNYTIQLPHDIKDISHKLRYYVVAAPNLNGVGVNLEEASNQSYAGVMEGKEAKIILIGERLWRNPYVFLGSQKATSVNVLPDMSGLVAKFDCVVKAMEDISLGSNQNSAVPATFIRVWTSENKTEKHPVNILPYDDQYGTPPCYLTDESLKSAYINRYIKRSERPQQPPTPPQAQLQQPSQAQNQSQAQPQHQTQAQPPPQQTGPAN